MDELEYRNYLYFSGELWAAPIALGSYNDFTNDMMYREDGHENTRHD